LKKRLEPTPGVAAVKVGGGLEDQIDVEIDQQRLQQVNLNVADVTKRLADENVNVSGGRIENGRSATSCARSTSSAISTRCATC
jgi:Cation/multidrug efflux pump